MGPLYRRGPRPPGTEELCWSLHTSSCLGCGRATLGGHALLTSTGKKRRVGGTSPQKDQLCFVLPASLLLQSPQIHGLTRTAPVPLGSLEKITVLYVPTSRGRGGGVGKWQKTQVWWFQLSMISSHYFRDLECTCCSRFRALFPKPESWWKQTMSKELCSCSRHLPPAPSLTGSAVI